MRRAQDGTLLVRQTSENVVCYLNLCIAFRTHLFSFLSRTDTTVRVDHGVQAFAADGIRINGRGG
jgi:hypothetical protein